MNVLAATRFECETQNDDSVVARTDGACVCNQDARFRRAGCGVIFCIGDERRSLLHFAWTNNGAELLAAIAEMRVQEGNLEIRFDSEYVVRVATIEGNADLWAEIVSELRLKTARRLHFVWV